MAERIAELASPVSGEVDRIGPEPIEARTGFVDDMAPEAGQEQKELTPAEIYQRQLDSTALTVRVDESKHPNFKEDLTIYANGETTTLGLIQRLAKSTPIEVSRIIKESIGRDGVSIHSIASALLLLDDVDLLDLEQLLDGFPWLDRQLAERRPGVRGDESALSGSRKRIDRALAIKNNLGTSGKAINTTRPGDDGLDNSY